MQRIERQLSNGSMTSMVHDGLADLGDFEAIKTHLGAAETHVIESVRSRHQGLKLTAQSLKQDNNVLKQDLLLLGNRVRLLESQLVESRAGTGEECDKMSRVFAFASESLETTVSGGDPAKVHALELENDSLNIKLCSMMEENSALTNQVRTLLAEQSATRRIFHALDSKIEASKIAYGHCKQRSAALERENEELKEEQRKRQVLLRDMPTATEWLKGKKELDKLDDSHQELERLRRDSESLLEMYNAVVQELQACKQNALLRTSSEGSLTHASEVTTTDTVVEEPPAVMNVDASTYATWMPTGLGLPNLK